MKTVNLSFNYREYSSIEEMEPRDRELVEAAIDAQKGSYAPYSKFNVGAAVRLDDGTIVKGANQENSAYPSGLCAERTAMFAANAQNPGKAMTALAIVGGFDHTVSDTPCTPCGACRQVMAEYQNLGGRPLEVIMFGAAQTWKFDRVDDILPFIFDSFYEK
ncbi:MAG: cytidine deaminase [Bacteroidales bacterium]|jgi:cytidine deaminase|nr:cytidine deaminase [Bacteroidales bacterium]